MYHNLQLHSLVPSSRANGPGLRAVVWVQGCTLACVGCFNPQTHAAEAGETLPAADVAARVLGLTQSIEGLTISGGEPLQQTSAVTELCTLVRRRSSLSIVLFSGYSWDEIQRIPGAEALLEHVDVLIAGRFEARSRVSRSLLGSSNQTFHFLTPRYNALDFTSVPETEVLVSATGEVVVTGIQPAFGLTGRPSRYP